MYAYEEDKGHLQDGNQRANPFIKISLGKFLQPYVNVFICSCLPLLWYIDIPSINILLW